MGKRDQNSLGANQLLTGGVGKTPKPRLECDLVPSILCKKMETALARALCFPQLHLSTLFVGSGLSQSGYEGFDVRTAGSRSAH
jgi:hypothetical protein